MEPQCTFSTRANSADRYASCSLRRRRCQRESNRSSCTLCAKHNVPCVATTTSAVRPKSLHSRSSGDGVTTASTQPAWKTSNPTASPVLSSHAVSLPQPSSDQGGATSPGQTDGEPVGGISLPPPAICYHLATLYFDYVHDQLHTLFQKPAFMTDMVMNKVPSVIMFAVVALSARYVISCMATRGRP